MTNNRPFTDITNQQLNKSVEDKDELNKSKPYGGWHWFLNILTNKH